MTSSRNYAATGPSERNFTHKKTSLRLMGFRSNSAPIMDHRSPASSFGTSSSPVQRLMGRLTRSLLPVPAIHLQPRVIPPRDVKQRLQQIRQKQRTFYNRSSKHLPELQRGSSVAVYNIPAKTWYPAEVVQTASTPRSYVVETEDGRQLQRTREHLRPAHQPSAPVGAPTDASVPASASPQQSEPEPLRRSQRERRPPKRYPDRDF
ncbi:uncharacterized protein LOC144141891 [Haemaphysalis longicornis]